MNAKASVFVATRHPLGWFLLLFTVALSPSLSWGYKPESPEVQAMLSRAMAYMNKATMNGAHSGQLGGQALVGLAVYKFEERFGSGVEPLPKMTQRALGKALGAARSASLARQGSTDNYSLGIALIFLTEVNPHDHMAEITALVNEMKRRQKANGSWGYSHEKRGDTSQLQYAVLGVWASKMVGIEMENAVMDRVVNYVLRVQDPSGGWGYQGADPGGFARIPQDQVRSSLSAAGLGSIYVAADFFGMSKEGNPREKKSLPPALMPVLDDSALKGGKLAGSSVDIGRMRQAMNDGNNWFRQHPSAATNMWQYYFLYGLERYQSFREKVEGTFEEEPRWYNEGVRVLQRLQAKDGSWGTSLGTGSSPSGCDPPVATAFGALFLLRSTRETIEKVIERDGILRGGYDLPSDLSDVRMRGNQIVAPAITGDVADMIQMLEDDEAENIENLLENPDALSLSGLTGNAVQFTERLARILRNGSYKARIVAARTLGRQGDLDNVPILIYALTDGDQRVQIEARNGLRLISRKFDGFGLSDKPAKGEAAAIANQWKAWYKSIRPDAVFMQ